MVYYYIIPNSQTDEVHLQGKFIAFIFGIFSPFPAHHHKSLQYDTEKHHISSSFLQKYFYPNFDGGNGCGLCMKQISRDQHQCKYQTQHEILSEAETLKGLKESSKD